MPPTAAPSASGVRIDANANAVSILRTSRGDSAAARSAYVAPRRMIPTPATKSGMASVDMIDPNATGYAVQKTVRIKMSQT